VGKITGFSSIAAIDDLDTFVFGGNDIARFIATYNMGPVGCRFAMHRISCLVDITLHPGVSGRG